MVESVESNNDPYLMWTMQQIGLDDDLRLRDDAQLIRRCFLRNGMQDEDLFGLGGMIIRSRRLNQYFSLMDQGIFCQA